MRQNADGDPDPKGSVPEPWPELLPVMGAHRCLPTDANGVSLYSERTEWCDRQAFDQGETEAHLEFFQVIEDVQQDFRSEEMENAREG